MKEKKMAEIEEQKPEAITATMLPSSFLSFLQQNEIDPKVYEISQDLPRFIR